MSEQVRERENVQGCFSLSEEVEHVLFLIALNHGHNQKEPSMGEDKMSG